MLSGKWIGEWAKEKKTLIKSAGNSGTQLSDLERNYLRWARAGFECRIAMYSAGKKKKKIVILPNAAKAGVRGQFSKGRPQW